MVSIAAGFALPSPFFALPSPFPEIATARTGALIGMLAGKSAAVA